MLLKASTWLSDSILTLLLTLMRYAWLWPWFEVVRAFLAPQYQGELLARWELIALPLVAFGLTRFVAGEAVMSEGNNAQGNDAPAWRNGTEHTKSSGPRMLVRSHPVVRRCSLVPRLVCLGFLNLCYSRSRRSLRLTIGDSDATLMGH